jgi:nucleoid-associated protein YgaU
MERRLFMHNRWQLLVVMALALAAYGGDNNSGTELSAAQAGSTTTTIQPTTTGPTPTTTTTNPPGEREPAQPGSGSAETTPTGQEKTYKVAEGDTLWTIARDHLAEAPGEPTNQEVAEYWAKVKAANRHRLDSGDPDLIEPGETIILPPVATPAEPTPETREQASHVVVQGDNLWTIAGDHLAEARSGGASELTTREVAAYWLRVIEANASKVRSGDPDLIYPGETIVLPPVD